MGHDYPTYRQQFVNCRKPACKPCASGKPSHGPYWYAEWKDKTGKNRTKYVGKKLPDDVARMYMRWNISTTGEDNGSRVKRAACEQLGQEVAAGKSLTSTVARLIPWSGGEWLVQLSCNHNIQRRSRLKLGSTVACAECQREAQSYAPTSRTAPPRARTSRKRSYATGDRAPRASKRKQPEASRKERRSKR